MRYLRIIVADDHQLVREGLECFLRNTYKESEIDLVADAYALEAKLITKQGLPNLVLVDLHMPGMQKGDYLPELVSKYPSVPFVVVSGYASDAVVRTTLRIDNVFAFVSKCASSSCLKLAIESALSGEKSKLTIDVNLKDIENNINRVYLPPRLSEVRQLLRQGLSNKLIAKEMGLSAGTVRNYLNEIYKTLNVNNRTQAAFFDHTEHNV